MLYDVINFHMAANFAEARFENNKACCYCRAIGRHCEAGQRPPEMELQSGRSRPFCLWRSLMLRKRTTELGTALGTALP